METRLCPGVLAAGERCLAATIVSAALMARYCFDREDATQVIEGAVDRVLKAGRRTADLVAG